MEKKYCFCFIFAALCCGIAAQISYSPAFFGPNANPVPEFTDATIPALTTVKLSGDCYTGFGDNTVNITFTAEIPLLSERLSFKLWINMLESYKVTQAVYDKRNMTEGSLSGTAAGDFYIQTRIFILSEKKYTPSVILNSTLKTASGNNFQQRRYFDTPGYYFDAEFGKSIRLYNSLLSEIRLVADLGFFCWETTNSVQNDAPMYGGKMILSNDLFDVENTLSGYSGWIDNGDKPLIYSAKINLKQPTFNIFAQYQYGINDFPYHHIRAGFSLCLETLTPKYK
ncbi:MAG: hypothetical protein LBH80_02900 [Prevotellaceae bacterium]|jgi:hypothetical protein|nr:hypothetical protein [Prevotellaceae bacterium]